MSSVLILNKGRSSRRGSSLPELDVPKKYAIPANLKREQPAKLPEVSELEVIRHYVNLSRKNLAIDTCFYPLGSCTMKYNPKLHERVAALPGFANLHPLMPQLRHGGALAQGALAVLYETEVLLCEMLGFSNFTMQPLAGSHGELTGIMMIAAYHKKNGENREVILIPDSAHGTNPASAAMAGFKIEELKTDSQGNVDIAELKTKMDNNVAGIMLTCPSTLGLFDPNIVDIIKLVHQKGGLCYCDGANLNAILGRVRPGDLGFDVMHVNLHKTFTTPHGGGGPGSGVVGVNKKLVSFLPISRVTKHSDGSYLLDYNNSESIGYIAPFYGTFGMILRAYAYILTLGQKGLVRVGENAVINANYIRSRLTPYLEDPYQRFCMHECVLSARPYLDRGVHAVDICKALLDEGYHPPTMYFPLIVPEALMIEPTETESKETMDSFVDAIIRIVERIETDPESVLAAPISQPVSRLDEAKAARHPDLANY